MQPPEPRRASPAIRHVPALDGIRGVAVALVVVFHDGLLRPSSGGLHGGFLGVDIFFVLSGYLITTLLLVEHRSNGRIDYRNFWARRMRRLLPAVLLLVVGVAVYARTIALQSERAQIRSESLATLAYVQNWHLIFTKTNSLVSLLNHAWSLAVEEQWYLVWPVVIVVLIGLTRRRGAALVGVILGLAAASAAWTWHVYANGVGEAHAYWGTDCRAQELLVGAALAVLLPIVEAALGRRPHVADGVGVVGVLAVAGFVATQHPGSAVLAHGGYLVLACCVAAVIVAARSEHRGVVQQSLSWRPLRSLGLISYGVYLAHWPIFFVLSEERTGLHGIVLSVVRYAVTLAVAIVSYVFVENPIRRGRVPARRLRVLAPAAIAATLAISMIATSDWATTPERAQLVPNSSLRTFGIAASLPGRRVLVVGHGTAFELVANGVGQHVDGINGAVLPVLGCGFTGGAIALGGGGVLPESPHCADLRPALRRVTRAFRPDVVVFVPDVEESYDRTINGRTYRVGSPEWMQWARAEFDATIDAASRHGAVPAVVTTSACNRVVAGFDTATASQRRADVDALADSYATTKRPGVSAADLAAVFCPGGRPAPVVDGVRVLDGSGKLTKAGAITMWKWIAATTSVSR